MNILNIAGGFTYEQKSKNGSGQRIPDCTH